ncbi:MAG: HNH endonuclease [Nocardioidaceae bacterium]
MGVDVRVRGRARASYGSSTWHPKAGNHDGCALDEDGLYTAGGRPPYADATGTDGLLRYKYRGDDPQHAENRALRRAYLDGLPLIWFVGVEPGRYEPIFPVWILQDEPEQLQFVLALDEGQRRLSVGESVDDAERRYAERVNKQRLHQPLFRARVLAAYDEQCAMCRLRHAELLDAAHILADAHPSGAPVVPNGLSLCKIHHAAFDRNIIGIRPDLKVHVRDDILREIDGPMLRHGIQEMHDATLTVPRLRSARPNEAWLDERYSTFLRTPAPQGAGHH